MTTLTVGLAMRRDRRDYPSLPKGVSRWVASSSGFSTGAGSGNVLVNVDFNPQSNPEFQDYVSLSSVRVGSETVALTEFGVEIQTDSDDFEDDQGFVSPLGDFQMRTMESATRFRGGFYEPLMLGRVSKGSPGRLQLRMQEILSVNYMFHLTGLISDKPFLAPYFWRT